MIWYGDFFGHHEDHFWHGAIFSGPDNHTVHDAHGVAGWVKVAPFVAMLFGLGLALAMYIKDFTTIMRPAIGFAMALVLYIAGQPLLVALSVGFVLGFIVLRGIARLPDENRATAPEAE